MSKSQTLRALVAERLSAAAEEIFELFERTLAEYEEELSRSREENQRLLDGSSPGTAPVRGGSLGPSTGPGPGLSEARVKEEPEEPSVKQEEEKLMPVPEFTTVYVKTEELPLLQEQTKELREETQDEYMDPEAETEDSSDSDEDPQLETEGEQCYQTPQTSAAINSGDKLENKPEDKRESGRGDGERKHECHICKKRFKQKDHLKTHFIVHSGERPFTCSICGKSFAYLHALNGHKTTHTDDRPFSCSLCGKQFKMHSALKMHSHVHTGEKPFICTVCEKSFRQKSMLRLHMRTHTGEKPYACSLCDKRFAQIGHLRPHMRTHTGEMPFCCTVCGRTFTQKSNLKNHMGTHTRPFSCTRCDKPFASMRNMERHMALHKERGEPAEYRKHGFTSVFQW